MKLTTKNAAAFVALPLLAAIAGCNSGAGTTGGGGTGGATGANLDVSSKLATVGTEDVTRGELYSLLEANGGSRALGQLIDYKLVMQHAKSKGVEIADDAVQAEISRRQETNPALAEVVKTGGARLEALRLQTRYQMALDALLTQNIKADPKAVEAWLNKPENRARYDQPEQVKFGLLFSSQKKRADLMSQQLKSNSKTFKQLVDDQKKANDPAAKQSFASLADIGPGGPAYVPLQQLISGLNLPKAEQAALQKLQTNETSNPIKLPSTPVAPQGAYVIVNMLERKPAVKAKADDSNVVAEYKLTQVALQTLKSKDNPLPAKTIEQAGQFLQQQNLQQQNFQQPTYRDILDFINQSQIQKITADLRSKGGVTIADAQYTTVGDLYKPAPAPPGAAGGAANSVGGAENAVGAPSDNAASGSANAASPTVAP